MKIEKSALKAIAEGATFLGTGGGGDPYTGRLVAERIFERYGEPELIPLEDVPDDINVYVAAMIGTPAVMVEKLMGALEMDLSIAALEKYTARPAGAIIAAEMGGGNSMVPLIVAALRGVPVIDADGMGRAFPELQMVTFNIHGVNASPMSMANEHGESIIIDARDSKETENKARSLVMEMGGTAAISVYPMDGRTAKQVAIPGTLTLAHEIGQALKRGRQAQRPVAALIEFLRTTRSNSYASVLFEGKIVNLERKIVGGFTRGCCHIRGHGVDTRILSLEYQNEHLVAHIDGQMLAMVPDLICVLDSDTGTPITTEGLKYSQRVSVVAASTPPIMRSEAALDIFGPRAFGYDQDFRPVEELHGLV